MIKPPETNIRSVIDEIALHVAEATKGEHDLESQIAEKAIAETSRLRDEYALSNEALERMAEAIVRGVLKRLQQIAVGGGQVGRASIRQCRNSPAVGRSLSSFLRSAVHIAALV